MSPKIKICGLTRPEETVMLSNNRVDYAGLVMFYEKSRRNNTVLQAEQILKGLPDNIQKVAVTVSPDVSRVRQIEQLGFDILQVHGELSEEVLEAVSIPVWQACNIEKEDDFLEISRHPKVKGVVLDGKNPGNGKPFDWSIIQKFDKRNRLFILAGGLCADNVQDALLLANPDVVDVSSGVEGNNGKDALKIQQFVRKVRTDE